MGELLSGRNRQRRLRQWLGPAALALGVIWGAPVAANADTLEVRVGVLRQEHSRETISIVDIPAADDFVAILAELLAFSREVGASGLLRSLNRFRRPILRLACNFWEIRLLKQVKQRALCAWGTCGNGRSCCPPCRTCLPPSSPRTLKSSASSIAMPCSDAASGMSTRICSPRRD